MTPAAALPHRDIELWLLECDRLSDLLFAIEGKVPRLAADEQARAAAMADRVDARRWLAGRIALRLLLDGCHSGIRGRAFAKDSHGRLLAPSGGRELSLSDSRGFLLIGLSRIGRIGVDLELPRTLHMSASRIARIMAAGESLGAAGPSPLQAWTRIEAFAKATGPTLAAVLARLGVQGTRGPRPSVDEIRARTRMATHDLGLQMLDLALPCQLTGALAMPRPAAAAATVRCLDAATLTALAEA